MITFEQAQAIVEAAERPDWGGEASATRTERTFTPCPAGMEKRLQRSFVARPVL